MTIESNSLMNVMEPGSYDRLRANTASPDDEPVELELGEDGVWAVPA